MPIDIYRLRQIAEFGLGNALIALSAIPLSTTTADVTLALRICGAIGVLFVFGGVSSCADRDNSVCPASEA